ncbi:MAG: hypothetical protein EOM34_04030 [Clostridia bacterium]|nr:hypothetical protein [Lachnospiraceae bacterium]NCB99835.1 hypothetical protein [Clostridia bacterium]NCD02774.1 hypothetical protein [Clostridia bacterium]
MNRFSKTSGKGFSLRSFILPVVLFLFFIGLFLKGVSGINATSDRESQRTLQNALNRSVIHCYAIEGRYPPSLNYLEEHYGIIYDENKFFVDYQPVASNIMPDITIISLEASE